MPATSAAELAARLDRLPSSRHVWKLVTLISLVLLRHSFRTLPL